MKTLNKKYKQVLRLFAEELQINVSRHVHDPRLIMHPIKIYGTDTFGWMTEVLHLKNIPGRLQIWIDLLPNIGRPVFSVCYNNGDLNRVKKVAESFTNKSFVEPNLATRDCNPYRPEGQVLSKPLPKNYFDKPLVESYQSKFFTFYLYNIVTHNNKSILTKAIKLSTNLIRAMASITEAQGLKVKDYPAIENRDKVSQHLSRERSQRLSLLAKTRDGFTCKICVFNFAEIYGDVGRGFAEAHHLIPLSKLRTGVKTNVKDLITVCSNCHRMLHKMDGHPNDVTRLRSILKSQKHK